MFIIIADRFEDDVPPKGNIGQAPVAKHDALRSAERGVSLGSLGMISGDYSAGDVPIYIIKAPHWGFFCACEICR